MNICGGQTFKTYSVAAFLLRVCVQPKYLFAHVLLLCVQGACAHAITGFTVNWERHSSGSEYRYDKDPNLSGMYQPCTWPWFDYMYFRGTSDFAVAAPISGSIFTASLLKIRGNWQFWREIRERSKGIRFTLLEWMVMVGPDGVWRPFKLVNQDSAKCLVCGKHLSWSMVQWINSV